MLSNIWAWDPEKTYSGSRDQEGTGSQIPDPQHWLWIVHVLLAARIRIQISSLMPIQIRIRIWTGIKTMPIHMRILPQFLHMLENRDKNCYFCSLHRQLTGFFLTHK